MKKMLVRTDGDVRVEDGNVLLLAGMDNTMLNKGFQKVNILGFLTDTNGQSLPVNWELNTALLDMGVALRGVKQTAHGWTIYLHCDEALKIKSSTPVVYGSVVESISLRAILDTSIPSGARLL